MAVAALVRAVPGAALLLLTLLVQRARTSALSDEQEWRKIFEQTRTSSHPNWTIPTSALPTTTLPGGLPEYYGAAGQPILSTAGVVPKSDADAARLVAILRASVVLRDNIVTVFGYILHQPHIPMGEELYSALWLLQDLVRLRKFPMTELVGTLPEMAEVSPRAQFVALFCRLERIVPRYARGGVDVWTKALGSGEVDLDSIMRPRGGPLVVDFLAGFDRATIDFLNVDESLEEDEGSNDEVFDVSERILPRVLAGLREKSIHLSEELFALIVLYTPRNSITPESEELERHFVSLLIKNQLDGWTEATAMLRSDDLMNSHDLVRAVLSNILLHHGLKPTIRRVVHTVLDHLKPLKPTYMNTYFDKLSLILHKPSVNVLKLLENIVVDEYPEEIVDLRWRIEHYIRFGLLDLEVPLKGFNRFDYKTPMDLLIAILTRIQTNLNKLPHEIASSINYLKLYISFKNSRATLRPLLNSDITEMLDAYDTHRVPNKVVIFSRKLKTQLEGEKVNWVEALQNIHADGCGKPRSCIRSLLEEAVKSDLLEDRSRPAVLHFLSLLNEKGDPSDLWEFSSTKGRETGGKSKKNKGVPFHMNNEETCFGPDCNSDIVKTKNYQKLERNKATSMPKNAPSFNVKNTASESDSNGKTTRKRTHTGRTSKRRAEGRSSRRSIQTPIENDSSGKISATDKQENKTSQSEALNSTNKEFTLNTNVLPSPSHTEDSRNLSKRRTNPSVTSVRKQNDFMELELRTFDTTSPYETAVANVRRKREAEISAEITTEENSYNETNAADSEIDSTTEYSVATKAPKQETSTPVADDKQKAYVFAESSTNAVPKNETTDIDDKNNNENTDRRMDSELPQGNYQVVTNEWSRKRRRKHRHYKHGIRPYGHTAHFSQHPESHAVGFESDDEPDVMHHRPMQFLHGRRPIRYRLTKYKRYKILRRMRRRHHHRVREPTMENSMDYTMRRTGDDQSHGHEYDHYSDEYDPYDYDEYHDSYEDEPCDENDPDCKNRPGDSPEDYSNDDSHIDDFEGSGDSEAQTEKNTHDLEESRRTDNTGESGKKELINNSSSNTSMNSANAPYHHRSRYGAITGKPLNTTGKVHRRHKHDMWSHGYASAHYPRFTPINHYYDGYPEHESSFRPVKAHRRNKTRLMKYKKQKQPSNRLNRRKKIEPKKKDSALELRIGLGNYNESDKNKNKSLENPSVSSVESEYDDYSDYYDDRHRNENSNSCDDEFDSDCTYEDSHGHDAVRAMDVSKYGSESHENDYDEEDYDDYDDDGIGSESRRDMPLGSTNFKKPLKNFREIKQRLRGGWNPPRFTLNCSHNEETKTVCEDQSSNEKMIYSGTTLIPWKGNWTYSPDLLRLALHKFGDSNELIFSAKNLNLNKDPNSNNITVTWMSFEQATLAEVLLEALAQKYETAAKQMSDVPSTAAKKTTATGTAIPQRFLLPGLSPSTVLARLDSKTIERLLEPVFSAKLPVPDESDELQPANTAHPETLLPFTVPGTYSDVKMRPLRIFLSLPGVYALLGDGGKQFYPPEDARKGPFLRQVLGHASKSTVVMRDPLLRRVVKDLLTEWAAARRGRAAASVDPTTLVDALPERPGAVEAASRGAALSATRVFLTRLDRRGDVLAAMGNVTAANVTKGQMLKGLLSRAAARGRAKGQDAAVVDSLREMSEAVLEDGLGAQAPPRVLPTTTARDAAVALSVDVRELLRTGLHAQRVRADPRAVSALKELLRAGTSRFFDSARFFRGFDAAPHRTRAQLLTAVLRHLSRAALTARARAAAQTLIPFVVEKGLEISAVVVEMPPARRAPSARPRKRSRYAERTRRRKRPGVLPRNKPQ